MSAAFVALLQHTLQEKVGSREGQAPKARANTGEPPLAVGAGRNFATLLEDLVGVAAEIARMDEMVAQAEAGAPAGEDARKWHAVSVQAFKWKRQAHAARQDVVLAELKALAQGARAGLADPAGAERVASQARSDGEPEAERSPEARTREPEAPPSPRNSAAQEPTAEEQLQTQAFAAGSLRADLERLHDYSTARCLMVRRIKRLGLESPQKLQAHFERYGAVTEVLVSHSFEKPSAKRRTGRFRPAAIGFVVMATEGAASTILGDGELHAVEDGADTCEVLVQSYSPQAAELEV